MHSILNHRNDTRHSLGLTPISKDLTPSKVRSNLSTRYSKTAKRFHIRRWLSLAVTLTLSVLSQSVLAQSTFNNPTRISISDDISSEASPYPSNISVSGLSGSVSKVTVTLTDLNFGFPRDVDILLAGPNGQSVILMSDANGDGTGHIINKTLTFDDGAVLPLPSDNTLTSGIYKPTNFDSETDLFPGSAPVTSYGTTLSVFNGTNPNSTWSLYMVDDNFDDPFGELPQEITRGWSLAVTTQTMPPSDRSVWSITGNLNVARIFHAATLLRDGKVLIIGGFGGGPSNSAELYDPVTGIWINAASSNLIHFYPTATLLPSGKVLVVSDDTVGIPTGGGVELFDPSKGTWSLTGRLNNQAYRTYHTATLLPNGKVLVAGGANGDWFFIATKSAELYDPATGTWTPTGNLNKPRALHTATLLPNGKVLVAGGIDWDEGGPIYDSAELYDPDTGIWSATGSLTTARSDHTATLLASGKVLVAGGLLLNRDYFVTNSAELYDPSTGNWSTTGSLSTTRHGQTATRLPDGEVLVAGGSSTNNASNTTLNTAELYNSSTGTWRLTRSLNKARQWHTATLLTNSSVLVAGGNGNSAELYSSTPTNPIDDAQFFVRQQYLDFLGREPDTVGFQNWVNTLGNCSNGGFGEFDRPDCDRVHVSAGFYLSEEFRIRGYWTYRFYQTSFGRAPRYTEFVPDMLKIGGEQSPTQETTSKQAFTDEWVNRPEFKAKYDQLNSPGAYVDEVLHTASVTLSNRDALVSALQSGQKTRAQVLREIVESKEVEDKFFIEGFVSMQYFGYLKRDPDLIGFNNWVQTLQADPSNFRHMIFGFIYSTEYRSRFGLL